MRCFCTSVRTFHFAHNYACVERGFLKKNFYNINKRWWNCTPTYLYVLNYYPQMQKIIKLPR